MVRECAALAGIALLIGLPVALALSRLLGSQLFHISAANPLSYATPAALLVVPLAVPFSVPRSVYTPPIKVKAWVDCSLSMMAVIK